uniref:glycosyltransferase family 4 protein n=1 Tax=Algoriphagus sp. TaxID=1872435 RepID=UPI004048B2D9
MSEVVSQISQYIVKQGHEVTVATSYNGERKNNIINGVKVKSFKISGNAVMGISGDIESYIEYLRDQDFDVITNFAAQQWATDLCFDILPELKAFKVFVPTGFSALRNPLYARYFHNMPKWLSYYDMNVFLSHDYQDINFARHYLIDNISVIPNGASWQEFTKPKTISIRNLLGIPRDYKIIIHVGSYTAVKGHDQALDIFLKSSFKKAVMLFLGHNFLDSESIFFTSKIKPLRLLRNKRLLLPHYIFNAFKYSWKQWRLPEGKKVFLLSVPRDQLIDIFRESDLLLLPSMIECSPVVIFESIASRTPFLVTDVGNSREIVKWTHGGEILPTIFDSRGFSIADVQTSAKLMDQLLGDDDKLMKMGERGFTTWKENFTWETIADRYLELYKKRAI